jgi:ribosome-binding protein aMBF1 (putative translation factor)
MHRDKTEHGKSENDSILSFPVLRLFFVKKMEKSEFLQDLNRFKGRKCQNRKRRLEDKKMYDYKEMEPKEYAKQFDMEIGMRIRECREKKGWSQTDLAAMLNVSAKMISKYESGESCCCSGYLKILAEGLEVSLLYLMGDEDERAEAMEYAEKWMKLPLTVRDFLKKGMDAFLNHEK